MDVSWVVVVAEVVVQGGWEDRLPLVLAAIVCAPPADTGRHMWPANHVMKRNALNAAHGWFVNASLYADDVETLPGDDSVETPGASVRTS